MMMDGKEFAWRFPASQTASSSSSTCRTSGGTIRPLQQPLIGLGLPFFGEGCPKVGAAGPQCRCHACPMAWRLLAIAGLKSPSLLVCGQRSRSSVLIFLRSSIFTLFFELLLPLSRPCWLRREIRFPPHRIRSTPTLRIVSLECWGAVRPWRRGGEMLTVCQVQK